MLGFPSVISMAGSFEVVMLFLLIVCIMAIIGSDKHRNLVDDETVNLLENDGRLNYSYRLSSDY
jgi:cbb3-type cytochrome oxidase subunit 3